MESRAVPGNVVAVGRFRLGDWLVEPSLNQITRGGEALRLRPRLVDVLVFLSRNAGSVVAKDDIIAAVWDRQFLAESVLTRCIAELRRALGDDASRPCFIETITKRGYRVIAPVEWLEKEPRRGAQVLAGESSASPSVMDDKSSAQPLPGTVAMGGLALSCCRLCWGEREIPLVEGDNMIGRGEGAALRIASTRVSRWHARIVVRGGRAVLEDLGSKNGTYLGGRRLAAPAELWDGAEICVGSEVFLFRLTFPAGTTEAGPV